MLENKKLTDEVLKKVTGGEIIPEVDRKDNLPDDPHCISCKNYWPDFDSGYDLNDSICKEHCANCKHCIYVQR